MCVCGTNGFVMWNFFLKCTAWIVLPSSLLHANSNWVRDGHDFLRAHTFNLKWIFQHRLVPVDVYISDSFTLCHFINTFDCYTVILKLWVKTLLKSHYLFIRFWSITLDFIKCNIPWPIYKWKCNCCLKTILSSYYNPIVWLHSSQNSHWTNPRTIYPLSSSSFKIHIDSISVYFELRA